jgi:hypothetical protein
MLTIHVNIILLQHWLAYDPDSNNITGTDAEADLYLNILGGGC